MPDRLSCLLKFDRRPGLLPRPPAASSLAVVAYDRRENPPRIFEPTPIELEELLEYVYNTIGDDPGRIIFFQIPRNVMERVNGS